MQQTTVVIIGGGPGGYEAAIRLAQYEIPVIVIEKERLGGVCLNWGCIPTKALVKSAELVSELQHAPEFGLPETAIALDYSKVWERKNAVVEQLVSGIEFLFRKRKIEVVKAEATKVRKDGEGYIVLAGDTEYACKYVIVATGSEAKSLPGIEIDEVNVLSSTGVLKLTELPKSMAIVGGGVIGCEFASVFHAFGVEITVIEFLPRLLPMEDEEISRRFAPEFKKQGIKVMTGKGVQSISQGEEGCLLTLSDGSTILADKVLMSVGRSPVNRLIFADLELETARNAILINEHMQTNLPGIYAIGDVTAKLQLAHTASKQGLIAVEHITSRERHTDFNSHELKYNDIPRCTFTHPEVASVGLNQAEATELFGEISIGKFPFSASGKALAMGATTGMVKTIARKDNGQIVGMHIMGPNAAELIAQGAILINRKCTAEEVENVVFAHPTLSEAIMESIEDLRNLSIHKI